MCDFRFKMEREYNCYFWVKRYVDKIVVVSNEWMEKIVVVFNYVFFEKMKNLNVERLLEVNDVYNLILYVCFFCE